MTKRFLTFLIALVLVPSVWAQATFYPPVAVAGTYPAVTIKAGQVINGGHLVTVAQQSVNVATNANCAAAAFAACNFIYSDNAGTVAVTSTLATAVAAGNTLLALVETNGGGTAFTSIVYPWQSGTMWNYATGLTGTNAAALTALSPASAGGTSAGTSALPFSGIYLGATATNTQLTAATPAGGRTITIPDVGATGAFGIQDPTVGTKQLLFTTSGATGASTLASALSASRTITLADPGGAAATLAYTNPTSAQALSATSISQTSATAFNSFMTYPMVLALATYTSVTDISGQQWFSSIFIPTSTTLTGACQLNGSSVATDSVIVGLWSSTGTLLANSNLAGQLVATASIFQCQAFTAPVAVTGPARYFVGIQGNGTHATEFTTYVTGSAPTGYAVGITAPGVFGTLTAITPTTSFTTGQGPVMTVY